MSKESCPRVRQPRQALRDRWAAPRPERP